MTCDPKPIEISEAAVSSFVDIISGLVEQERTERGIDIIDGTRLEEVLPMVDLSIAHSPVVRTPAEGYDARIIAPEKMEKWPDGRFAIVRPADHDFDVVPEREAIEARGRFLLLRDYYYRRLLERSLSHPEQQRVVAWYFDGAVWTPEEGSDLRKAMLATGQKPPDGNE